MRMKKKVREVQLYVGARKALSKSGRYWKSPACRIGLRQVRRAG